MTAGGGGHYSGRPLPPYAFLPGRDPHPTADARGHSRDVEPYPIRACPPDEWQRCEPWLYGVDCFNAGFWWEAHEAWEPLWRACARPSEQAEFLQGLIQAANALLKRRMGRPRAVARLRDEVARHLDAVPSATYMGLEVPPWREAVLVCLASPDAEHPAIRLAPKTNL